MITVDWYNPMEGEFPELNRDVVYLDNRDKGVKEMSYRTDWINKHKKHLDITFKNYARRWCYKDDLFKKEEINAESITEQINESPGPNNG